MNRQTDDGLIVSQPIKGFSLPPPPVYNLYRQVRKEDLKRDGRNICIAKKECFFAFGSVLKWSHQFRTSEFLMKFPKYDGIWHR